jgi:CRISPR-associated protein Cas5t
MKELKAIHIRLEGFTSFLHRHTIISGNQPEMPCPGYSTILGLIGCVGDREIDHSETRIAYEFRCLTTQEDLMRTNRLMVDKKGRLIPHNEQQGIREHRVHIMPKLDLYLTNMNFKEYFENPKHFPRLGRSEDLMWIKKVEEVELTPVANKTGCVGPTLIPMKDLVNIPPGKIVSHAEYFHNNTKGYCRTVGAFGRRYVAIIPTIGTRYKIRMNNDTLYHPSNLSNEEDVIYLHEWESN